MTLRGLELVTIEEVNSISNQLSYSSRKILKKLEEIDFPH
jgi:hypothetical protein